MLSPTYCVGGQLPDGLHLLRLPQLALQDFPLGDIPADADQADDLSLLVTQRNLGRQQPAFLTLVVGQRLLFVEDGPAGLENHLVVGEELFGQLFREQGKIVLAQDFGL